MSADRFPHPFTADTLPAHRARTLTAEEREALPTFYRQDNVPGNGFITLSAPGEGSFTLYPERMNGKDPMCQINYRQDMGEVTEDGLFDKTVSAIERGRRHQMLSGAEIGTVWSQEKAIELLDFSRRHAFEGSTESLLEQSGFTQKHPDKKFYHKRLGKGGLTMFLKDHGVWLIYDPPNASHWHNLAIFNTHRPWADGEHCSPIYWPPTVADPYRASVGMGLRMAEIWTPDLIKSYKNTKTPKP